jgi:hypothetical protein
MTEHLYTCAEDDKLHYLGRGGVLLCGKVMVSKAAEPLLATRELCEDCRRLHERPKRGRARF